MPATENRVHAVCSGLFRTTFFSFNALNFPLETVPEDRLAVRRNPGLWQTSELRRKPVRNDSHRAQ